MPEEKKYLFAISSFVLFGPKRIVLLHNYFESYKNIWKADSKTLLGVGLSSPLVEGFIKHRNKFDIDTNISRIKKENIKLIFPTDKDFPEQLKGLDDSPPVLYVKGEINPKRERIAIVGSRKMTVYGQRMAEMFSSKLSHLGVDIVSGLALGVDSTAHKACLDAGGITQAIMPCGLDIVYPKSNYYLAKEIIKNKGALISEYPLGYPPFKINFARRNRIISGISKGVIVIEGDFNSGTLLTASAAAEQGKTVFAVPGQITSPMSRAPHFLIQNGAKIIFGLKDVVDELDLKLSNMPLKKDKTEEDLLGILGTSPMSFDMIARISGLTEGIISAKLSIMEIKGFVKYLGASVYQKT